MMQFNSSNVRVADCTLWAVLIRPPDIGYAVADIVWVKLYVEGFTGGLDGDNWSPDGINVQVVYIDDAGDDRIMTIMNESGSPFLRFTGELHEYVRRFDR